MSNPTTPFSWQMPTATDLVTDLPADFEVFGQAVATSMQDLLGGTSGQILSKASATDMDFTWITNDVGDITAVTAGTGITGGGTSGAVTVTNSMATTITTKGDLVPGTGSGTFARLAAGNNGETLVADSSAATGLRYQSDRAGAKNGLINSAFDVSQRGATITGIAADNTYTADRWYVTRGGTIDYALKTVAGGNNPPTSFDSYAQYINQTATNPFMSLAQTLETKDSIRFAGTAAATLSFYARATANTTKSKSITASIGYNTTADTKINTLVGTTTFTTVFGTAATDWTLCTLTVGIPSTAKTVGAYFIQSPAGGLAVGDGFEITGVQLERAAVATAFQRNSGTMQAELAACQRYYWRAGGQSAYQNFGMGIATSATNVRILLTCPVQMRTSPSSIDFSTLASYDAAVQNSVTAVAFSQQGALVTAVDCTSTGLTTSRPTTLIANNSTSAYIGLNAEL